ncbi:hypothetical protein OWR29_23805 [Actinoplanes sp. Pm04-4]|uniref:Uncharacterized protein n=1 Tax=Paractinoplanes pyxinae TaxID=2997416 RepID=A0ABT4B3F9_9ACTN|nr:hypothetical protein [Actinoplanes pyxinae]MCY1141034.1 hypothetical protein [Actinoplanes pyxinae]
MTTLIGGEMLLWSDLDGSHGRPPDSGATLRSLLSQASGRTLVAGPHDPELIGRLAQPTVLVRGDADAALLSSSGVAVLCGSLEKLAASPEYDTVIALDGLDRLLSAEAEPHSWSETLDLLLAVLKPGGRLLLGVQNLFGVDRLVALPAAPTDAEWEVPDDHDPARPAGHAGLLAHLTVRGLQVERDYAAYPSLSSPTVLLSREILASPDLSGTLEAAVVTAVQPSTNVLTDPARLATAAVRNGLAAELAPAWFVIARRAAGALPSVRGEAADAVINGAEFRLPDVALPRGRTLQDHLLAAAQRRDLPTMRDLLSTWQSAPAAGVPAGQIVVTADGDLTALAPAGEPLSALRAFAREAIAGGYAHLWPIPADEAELTAVLAGMTGRELEPSDVPPADEPPAHAVADLLADRDRLTRELSEAKAKHEWYEQMLFRREAELKRVRQMNALLSATIPGKAATSLVGGLRAGKRAMRSVVRRTRGN